MVDAVGGYAYLAQVNIGVDDVNDAPVAVDDADTTPEEHTDTHHKHPTNSPQGGTSDPTTVSNVTGPTNGTLVNNGDGTVTYKTNAN